jgi:hypothetical protein
MHLTGESGKEHRPCGVSSRSRGTSAIPRPAVGLSAGRARRVFAMIYVGAVPGFTRRPCHFVNPPQRAGALTTLITSFTPLEVVHMQPQTATSTERAQEADQGVVVRCPATGERVGAVPVTPRPEIEAAAARLRAAQPAWQAMGAEGRAEWLGRWRDWLFDHEDELSRLMQRESGKSWGDTALEVPFATVFINYWAENAVKFLADENVSPTGVANTIKQ